MVNTLLVEIGRRRLLRAIGTSRRQSSCCLRTRILNKSLSSSKQSITRVTNLRRKSMREGHLRALMTSVTLLWRSE